MGAKSKLEVLYGVLARARKRRDKAAIAILEARIAKLA